MKFLAVLALLVPALSFGQYIPSTQQILPMNEASQDASFVAFLAKLNSAIEKKDAKFIKSILSKRPSYSFGEDVSSINGFMAYYGLNAHASNAKFWGFLKETVNLGCVRSKDSNGVVQKNYFACPYMFELWPEDFDSVDYMVVTGSNVNVRAEASTTSAVIGQVSYKLLEVDYNQVTNGNFVAVKFGDKTGYVSSKYIRSGNDFRVGFNKTARGTWEISHFIAGD